jgi:hypothetical protein
VTPRDLGNRLLRLERQTPPPPTGRVRILVHGADEDAPLVKMSAAECEAAGMIWIPDVDDRPEPEAR